MKILFLTHRIPYPPNKGDKIRSFNEIKHLCRAHEIDLLCLADHPEDVQYQKHLEHYCSKVFVLPFKTVWAKLKGLAYLASGRSISVGYFYWNKLQQTVDKLLAETKYDAVLCFSSPMAQYVFRSKQVWTERAQGTRRKAQGDRLSGTEVQGSGVLPESCTLNLKPVLVMDFCDVDSDKWRQYSRLSTFPKNIIYRLEHHRLAIYERKIAEHFDHSVFVSEREAEIFKKQDSNISNVMVIPNGVDYNYFSPASRSKVQGERYKEISFKGLQPRPCSLNPTLLFTGAMDYHANVDGVTWFCDKIYPEIKRSVPDVEFYIVGSNPNPKVRALRNNNGVKVTGFVEDIRPYYQVAAVCVIPLRLARGVQNKVLEAMAMGKAVVSTSSAIQGINAMNEELLIVADDPRGFSNAVLTLLKDENRRRELGTKARQFVEAHYHWPTNMNKFEQLFTDTNKPDGS